MKKILLVSGVISMMTLSLFGAGIDCSKAKSDVEKTICHDEELMGLDKDLADAYKDALIDGTYYDQYTPNPKKIRKKQQQWIKERNTCKSDIDCLIDKYHKRIGSLVRYYGTFDDKPPTELSPIKYTLIMNQNNALCSHLLELYNQDIEQFQKVVYDNHAEFTWLKWEAYVKPAEDEKLSDLIGGVFLDINHDGKEDFIFVEYRSSYQKIKRYLIYDHNVSDFFKHSPINGKEFPEYTLVFNDYGVRDTNLKNRNTRGIDGIKYSLISHYFDKLPPYTVKSLKELKKDIDDFEAQYKDSPHYEITFYPTNLKTEIRFLRWKDGKTYMVFEGSSYYGDRNKYNLVSYLQEDYLSNPQCLFYKKIR